MLRNMVDQHSQTSASVSHLSKSIALPQWLRLTRTILILIGCCSAIRDDCQIFSLRLLPQGDEWGLGRSTNGQGNRCWNTARDAE